MLYTLVFQNYEKSKNLSHNYGHTNLLLYEKFRKSTDHSNSSQKPKKNQDMNKNKINKLNDE